MQAILISIGDELLIGHTVNTNAAWIARQLNMVGISVLEINAISDNHQAIIDSVSAAMTKATLVIVTGGLGPTRDDVTKKALCDLFHSQLISDAVVISDITTFFARRGLPLTTLNESQALVPDNAAIIRNPVGTAPGMWFDNNAIKVISLPGVPHEMQHMMINDVVPMLKKGLPDYHIVHKMVLTQGIGESFLAEKIKDWEQALPSFISLAYLPSPGIVKLRLTARGENRQLLEDTVQEQLAALKAQISTYIWGYDDDSLELLIGKLLKSKNKTMATAESCTGGYIAHRITSVPGSSAYFKASIVAYDNDIKSGVLKVSDDLIRQYGAVSSEVVEAMAKGAAKLCAADYALAVSGIAGPDGGTEEKPVGTVWIACATHDRVVSKIFNFGDVRERNIIRAATAGMAMLKGFIEQA